MTRTDDIIAHFKKKDLTLYSVLENIELNVLEPSHNYFEDLCDSIVSQQLSIKAAATIFSRFKDLMPSKKITPENILMLSHQQLRNAGLSNAKAVYIKDLAQKVHNNEIHFEKFLEMTEDEIITELTKVKGIGRWTAEMFLMFTLAREDVFSHGDLGLQNAIRNLYKLKKRPTEKYMQRLSSRWKPYRTYAARILWKSLSK